MIGFLKSKIKVICPYCKETLDRKPQRKKKCPFCKNFIYVRTLPSTRNKVLVTETEAQKIDQEWERISFRSYWLSELGEYGITEKDFDFHERKLAERFKKEPSGQDVVWSIFNELTLKIKDLQDLKTLYYGMALFLNEEGKDFFAVLQQSAKMELLDIKQSAIFRKVRMRTSGESSCDSCRQLEGKILTIEEALEKLPIPNKNCTFKLHDEKRGFCRCFYQAVIEEH